MSQRRRPITDTQAIERVLGELHRQREQLPERVTAHDAFARMGMELADLEENLRGIENTTDKREIGLRIGALAIRFLVECT